MKIYMTLFLLLAGLCLNTTAKVVRPFETGASARPTVLDEILATEYDKHSVEVANLCSNEVFLRRAYVDIAGMIPKWQQSRNFLANKDENKRKKLINTLLDSPEFTDYTTMYWCNVLRVKSEFPINLWPNAVQAYHRWVRDAVEADMPYDQFARELLTSSGSNFRVPQVNFYRAIQGKSPSNIASAVCLTFMGIRFEKQSEEFRENMEKIFSCVAYKSTGEWKEEVVYCDPTKKEEFEIIFPDGTKVIIKPGQDPREVFCDWLLSPDNDWFARCIVNRIWARLNGRGIIEPADDIYPDKEVASEELLRYLEGELVKNKYDMKSIYRIILNSNCWQRSSIAQSNNSQASSLFAYYHVRRLDAETLSDALSYLSGIKNDYSSMVPEPFTFIPGYHSTVQLADGSITSQFLEMFGRPSRDLGTISERNSNPTDSQLLHILNSTEIHNQTKKSWQLSNIVRTSKNTNQMIRQVYLLVLSRYPTAQEQATVKSYMKEKKVWKKKVAEDLMWTLINTKEFLYKH